MNVQFCCVCDLMEYNYHYTKEGEIDLDCRTNICLLREHTSAPVFNGKYCTLKFHLGNFSPGKEMQIKIV